MRSHHFEGVDNIEHIASSCHFFGNCYLGVTCNLVIFLNRIQYYSNHDSDGMLRGKYH